VHAEIAVDIMDSKKDKSLSGYGNMHRQITEEQEYKSLKTWKYAWISWTAKRTKASVTWKYAWISWRAKMAKASADTKIGMNVSLEAEGSN